MHSSADLMQVARPYWRIFYTMSRAEKKCEQELLRRGIEVMLPKCVVVRQWKDRKKKIVEPLFRNYIFAHVTEQERLQVVQTNGIVRCVFFDGRAAALSTHEVEQLQIAQQEPQRLSLYHERLPRVGEEVSITEGPLQGLKGPVLEIRGQQHIVIQVNAIRQAIAVSVPAEWIERDRAKLVSLS